MTRLEKLKRCAELMYPDAMIEILQRPAGIDRHDGFIDAVVINQVTVYEPDRNPAQAFELVEKLQLDCDYESRKKGQWIVYFDIDKCCAEHPDLKTAIVDCAAKAPHD